MIKQGHDKNMQGRPLKPVHGPIVYTAGSNPVHYQSECLITTLGHTGQECGWAIQMHEDATVELKYLYLPDPETQPGLAIDQPGAPAPLVFTAGGLFRDPIGAEKLEPVRAPR